MRHIVYLTLVTVFLGAFSPFSSFSSFSGITLGSLPNVRAEQSVTVGMEPGQAEAGGTSDAQAGENSGPNQASAAVIDAQAGESSGPNQPTAVIDAQAGESSGPEQPAAAIETQAGESSSADQTSAFQNETGSAASRGEVGPAFDPKLAEKAAAEQSGSGAAPKKEIGPGIMEEGNGDVSVGTSDISVNNFLDIALSDPIVNAAEKYSYDQMEADIQKLKARYGDRLKVNVIGQSHDGRSIYELIVGSSDAPKHLLMQGAIHAREYMTPLLMMRQLETALAYYDSGVYAGIPLRELFGQTALHMVPMSNPDGVTLAQFGINGIRSDFVKQAVITSYAQDTAAGLTALPFETYLTKWKSNAAGVDLNHNFPARWEEISTQAVNTSFAGYKGAASLSEPESQALAALSDKNSWAATISYHSMGNVIYWDTRDSKVKEASKVLAERIMAVTGYKIDGSDGVGGYKDWMQSRDNAVPGITIEVGSVACPLPISEWEPVWQQNRAVWAEALKFVAER